MGKQVEKRVSLLGSLGWQQFERATEITGNRNNIGQKWYKSDQSISLRVVFEQYKIGRL